VRQAGAVLAVERGEIGVEAGHPARDRRSLRRERAPAFREYIAWLQRRDPARAEAFWRSTLGDFTSPTPLPEDRRPGRADRAAQSLGEARLVFPAAVTAGFQRALPAGAAFAIGAALIALRTVNTRQDPREASPAGSDLSTTTHAQELT